MQDQDDAQLEAADDAAAKAAETEDSDDSAAIETEARRQGWVPREEFRGNPKNWSPADEYVRMGDPRELRKRLKETQDRLAEEAAARRKDQTEFTERLERFERMSKAQRAKLYNDIAAAKRAAVKEGDEETYAALERQEEDMFRQEQAAEQPPKKQPAGDGDHPDQELIESWIDENPWWDTEPKMQHAAMTINARITKRYPKLTTQEQLDKTREAMEQRFPDYAWDGKPKAKQNGTRPGYSAVEGGQRMPAARGGKGWADIPAEDRKIIQGHIEEGLYKDKADAAAQYWKA